MLVDANNLIWQADVANLCVKIKGSDLPPHRKPDDTDQARRERERERDAAEAVLLVFDLKRTAASPICNNSWWYYGIKGKKETERQKKCGLKALVVEELT